MGEMTTFMMLSVRCRTLEDGDMKMNDLGTSGRSLRAKSGCIWEGKTINSSLPDGPMCASRSYLPLNNLLSKDAIQYRFKLQALHSPLRRSHRHQRNHHPWNRGTVDPEDKDQGCRAGLGVDGSDCVERDGSD